ncbi:MAG: insulinase family protein [Gemmatimonadetes bacterium]|nr:insulinase family protein [Gemmatimonadota bacterium]
MDIPYTKHVLDNGLTLIVHEDHKAPIVAVNIWYHVDSKNEKPGKTGFAHLFEHLMFQGSVNVPDTRHIELIERAGGSMNGSTWFDRTNYFETLPSHHLELALWLESDRMGWMLPAITQEKLDNQRDVVKNEKRQRYDNQPYGDWDQRLQALVFPEDHPYHHPVIGSMEDLDAATLDDVEAFFRTYYVPNNAVLTVAGDFVPEAALAMIERWFGDIPVGRPIPPVPGRIDIPATLGHTARERVVEDVPLPRVFVACRVPPYTDASFYPAEVAGSILGSGRASRLYRTLVRERRVAKDAAAFVFPLVSGAAMLLVRATGYAHVTVETLERAVLEQLDALEDASGKEVERAVAVTETRLVRTLERVGERADLLSMFTTFFDDPERLNGEMDRIRAVTPGEIRAFAGSRLGADNRAVLSYVPRSEA